MRIPDRKNKQGFTMVELIVVIVIILVLAAVLVPSLLKYIDKANQAKCRSEAATLLTQIQADFAASQASEQTGIEESDVQYFKIGNVTVLESSDALTKDFKLKPFNATYFPATTNGHKEIISFMYNDGKYVALWTETNGWELFKNTIPIM